MKKLTPLLSAALIVLLFVSINGTSYAAHGLNYEVTITNITRGQVITPPVVISHRSGFELFVLGEPAIDPLVQMAEEGAQDPLINYAEGLPTVLDTSAATAPLFPGESVTLPLKMKGNFRYITAVGMLANTNDAFFAIRGVRPLRSLQEITVYAEAYDAGSEGNSELCEHVPGPACGSAGVRYTDGAEGFVHIHAGIHDVGDLIPAIHDWRNPVVEIKIRRVY